MHNIAVIMSVYKNDKLEHLKEALGSLYAQTKQADIFIQLDGEVPIEIEKYLDKELENHKIIYLGKRESNKGLAFSLNELLEIVLPKYYYIARMDADDISNIDRFKKQIEFMENNKDIDICGTFIREFGDGIEYEKIVKYPLTHQKMFNFFKKRVPLAHVSVCFRDSFFEKAGLYSESGHITNEDTLMWMKGFLNGCKFANIDYIGVNVRVSKNFFNRRRSLKKLWYDFKNRLEVNQKLNYGIDSYIYAIGMFIINLLPHNLKKIAYKILR